MKTRNKKAVDSRRRLAICRALLKIAGQNGAVGPLYEQAASVAARVLGLSEPQVASKTFAKSFIKHRERVLFDYLKANGMLRNVEWTAGEQKPKAPLPKTPKALFVVSQASSPDFLQTYEWRRVRMEALKKYGARCQCCGATPATGAVMNVDHIKPRKLFPHLALDVNNLQVLCHECNHGKGNWDMTDWRGSQEDIDPFDLNHIRAIAKGD